MGGATELLFLATGVALVLVFYVFSAHRYSIESGQLVVRWRVMGVPFAKRCIPIREIGELRKFDWRHDLFPGFEIWGTLVRGDAWIVVRTKGMLRKVYITPPDPPGLQDEIHRSR